MAAMGDFENAVAVATQAPMLDPRKPDALAQLASIFADVGDADRLEAVTNRLKEQFPGQKDTLYYSATADFSPWSDGAGSRRGPTVDFAASR
jgi:hypothetical protein